MSPRPVICLNMIVRNEAHIVCEVLDAVAPYIGFWVIVDTGSEDGTQDLVRAHMARLGIAGELHERPWKDFGHNRSEALALAQGHGDYLWVIDADDMVVGTPDFHDLTADVYDVPYGEGCRYWRRQLFRDGMPWRYVGVVHEYAACDSPFTEARLEGDYYIESRRLGGRNLDQRKYERDRDLLLAEVLCKPDDVRSVFYLAQSYFDLGDFGNARKWYARRAEMGDFPEEVYFSLFRVAEALSRMGAPWAEAQNAYLKAWAFRPTRAEPLFAIAHWYRMEGNYQLGYLFAEMAARIPLPEHDVLYVGTDIYSWRALDEQGVCAGWIGRHGEALVIFQQLLEQGLPSEEQRARVAANRDFCVAQLAEADRMKTIQPS